MQIDPPRVGILPHSGAEAVALAAFVVAVLAVAWVGSAVTLPAIPTWYASLAKPSFTPPNWVFGPVWTALYLMMAYAAWRVWATRRGPRTAALALFAAQLAVNLAWSLLFFGAKQIGWAIVDIAVLLAAIVGTVIAFGRVDRVAAWLLAPYLAWVSYATALNVAVWRLN